MSKRCITLNTDWLKQLKLEFFVSILQGGLVFIVYMNCISGPGYRSRTVSGMPQQFFDCRTCLCTCLLSALAIDLAILVFPTPKDKNTENNGQSVVFMNVL